jgi:hypothetical protein
MIGHEWEVCAILPMIELTRLVKVTLIEIILLILHKIFDKIGIQDPTLEIV